MAPHRPGGRRGGRAGARAGRIFPLASFLLRKKRTRKAAAVPTRGAPPSARRGGPAMGRWPRRRAARARRPAGRQARREGPRSRASPKSLMDFIRSRRLSLSGSDLGDEQGTQTYDEDKGRSRLSSRNQCGGRRGRGGGGGKGDFFPPRSLVANIVRPSTRFQGSPRRCRRCGKRAGEGRPVAAGAGAPARRVPQDAPGRTRDVRDVIDAMTTTMLFAARRRQGGAGVAATQERGAWPSG